MRVKPVAVLILTFSSLGSVWADQPENYYQCMTSEAVIAETAQSGEAITTYCTMRHFDTAPTAFQATVLVQNLAEFKQRDPKFKAFFDKVRDSGSNDIYTDRQIVLMYIDKREVNKD